MSCSRCQYARNKEHCRMQVQQCWMLLERWHCKLRATILRFWKCVLAEWRYLSTPRRNRGKTITFDLIFIDFLKVPKSGELPMGSTCSKKCAQNWMYGTRWGGHNEATCKCTQVSANAIGPRYGCQWDRKNINT